MRSLLSGDSEGLSASSGGLGVLTFNLEAPVVSQTSMVFALSHSLHVLSVNGIQSVGNEVGVHSSSWVFWSVQEPLRDVVL